jgi:hypothetical protein
MMGFFLLGRSADDVLSLLSPNVFVTRQDALAELSRITADPSFGSWGDEVFVFEADSGTPVLLVRPAAAVPAEAVEPETVGEDASEESESGAFATVADDEPVVTPVGVAAAMGEEATQGASGATEPESADQPASEPEDESDLRAAIARTTEHMEETGVVAPESIGAPESAEPAEETAQTEEPAPVWPWDSPLAETTSGDEEPSSETVSEHEPDVAHLIDVLEEPSIDDSGSLITSRVDEDSPDTARVVVLGDYDEAPSEGSAAEQTASTTPPAEEPPAPTEAIDQPEAASSDYVMLEPTAPGTAPVMSKVDPPDEERSLEAYTCNDCVYCDTCPNKDQRLPKDCGSFQWK